MLLRLINNKKAEPKPYLARLSRGFQREFAKGYKFSGNHKAFDLEVDLGDVIDFRAQVWDGNEYAGGYGLGVVVIHQGVPLVIRISRNEAERLLLLDQPAVESLWSDYPGDLSSGVTTDEEARIRTVTGGDWGGWRMRDGSVAQIAGEIFGAATNPKILIEEATCNS